MYRKWIESISSGLVLYAVFLTILIAGITLWYLGRLNWTDPEFGFIDMMNGTAYRPYVFRVLVPLLARGLTIIHPVPPVYYVSGIMFLSLVGFALTMRSFAWFIWKSRLSADLASILSIVALFPFLIRDGKIYDFSAIFLFALGLLLIARKQWGWYLIVFIVGCINKETMVFLIVVFFAYYSRRLKTNLFIKLLFLQFLVFCIIKFILSWVFKDSPGQLVKFQLELFIYVTLNLPYYWKLYGSFALCTAIFVFSNWRQKPEFLRYAALSLIPVVLIVNILFARPYELRNFMDLFPAFILLSFPTLGRVLRIPVSTIENSTE